MGHLANLSNNVYINHYFILTLTSIFVYVLNKFCCSTDIPDAIDCVVMGSEFLEEFQYKVGIWSQFDGRLLSVPHCDHTVMVSREKVPPSAVIRIAYK